MDILPQSTSEIARKKPQKVTEKERLKRVTRKKGSEKVMEKRRLEKAIEERGPKEVTEEKRLEKAIERSRSNILPCREGMPFAKMLFELICNLSFEVSLFLIGIANNNKLCYLISAMSV